MKRSLRPKDIKSAHGTIDVLVRDIIMYREALEYYADGRHYSNMGIGGSVVTDTGWTAEHALDKYTRSIHWGDSIGDLS